MKPAEDQAAVESTGTPVTYSGETRVTSTVKRYF